MTFPMGRSCRLAVLCTLPLALAACQEEKKAAEAGTAQGEILEGSASDAMLPLDTVRSQPPLAPLVVPSGASGKASSASDTATPADEGESGASEAPAPAATPSIEADPGQ